MNRTTRKDTADVGKSGSLTGTLMGTSKLTGGAVCDAKGSRIGKIEDIVIDTRTGCVRYAVVALGGVFGIGARRYAVQWNALAADASGKRCLLNVGHLWLTGSPLAADSRWPDTVATGDTSVPTATRTPAATMRDLPASRRVGPMWPSTSFGKP